MTRASTQRPTPPPPPWWGRRWSFRLAAVGLALGALLLVDTTLRAAWYSVTFDDHGVPHALSRERLVDKGFLRFVPDHWLGTHYVPGIRLHLRTFNMISGQWSTYLLHTGALGFRGAEVAPRKAPGTLRVVAMGGSSTMGQGVQEQETYIARLGHALARRFPGHRVEVINAGVQGYASAQGYRQYARDIRPLRPDLLVVAYDVNDGFHPMTAEQLASLPPPTQAPPSLPLDRFPPEQQKQLGAMVARSRNRWLLDRLHHSGLYLSGLFAVRWIHEWATFKEGGRDDGYSGPLPDPNGKGKSLRCPASQKLVAVAPPWSPEVASYRANLLALEHLARRDGVAVIYLSVPLEGFLDLRAAWPYSATMRELAAARADRRYVDPSAAFRGHLIYKVMIDFCHPTALGHALIARALEPAAHALLAARLNRIH